MIDPASNRTLRLNDQLDLLYEQLRESSDESKRQEVVHSAILAGVSPAVIQEMLDHLELMSSTHTRRFHGWHRLRQFLHHLCNAPARQDRHN